VSLRPSRAASGGKSVELSGVVEAEEYEKYVTRQMVFRQKDRSRCNGAQLKCNITFSYRAGSPLNGESRQKV